MARNDWFGVEHNFDVVGRQIDLEADRLKTALAEGGERVGIRVMDLYEGTSRTWKHRPKFHKTVDVARDLVSTIVETDDNIYRFVDQGTRPHIIRPKNKKILAFQPGFTPKTSPGSLTSGGGGRSGVRVVARVVRHPGSKPREFTAKIQEEMDRAAPRIYEQVINQWVRSTRG